MRARYDLRTKTANFQFFNWLALAKARGATEIVLDADQPKTAKWSADEAMARFRSIIVPGALLGRTKVSFGDQGRDLGFDSHHIETFVSHVRGGGRWDRFTSVRPAGKARYTVTLRRLERFPKRNSNEAAWRTFAAEIGATVIEEWSVRPTPLIERVALYAGAEMNFFVNNGPMHLCSLTPYPLMAFGCPEAQGALARIGVPAGGQMPWCLPQQRLVWEMDELPALRRAFSGWREEAADVAQA